MMTTKREQMENEGDSAVISELNIPLWSVISFSGVENSKLTYSQAIELRDKLAIQHITGLCIVTDRAAGRLRLRRQI